MIKTKEIDRQKYPSSLVLLRASKRETCCAEQRDIEHLWGRAAIEIFRLAHSQYPGESVEVERHIRVVRKQSWPRLDGAKSQ